LSHGRAETQSLSSSSRDAHCSGGLSGGREIISVRIASVVPRDFGGRSVECRGRRRTPGYRPGSLSKSSMDGRAILSPTCREARMEAAGVSGGREMHSVVIVASGCRSWFRSVGSRGGKWSPVVIKCLKMSTRRCMQCSGKIDLRRACWTPSMLHGTHPDGVESAKRAIDHVSPCVRIA